MQYLAFQHRVKKKKSDRNVNYIIGLKSWFNYNGSWQKTSTGFC